MTFLGSGTSSGVPVVTCRCAVCRSTDPRDRRLRPSVLLEWEGASVLIDTSTDLREQALRVRLTRIDAVLYTHAHADHILGLDELRMYNWRQQSAIRAYGAPDTLRALARTFWYAFEPPPPGGSKPSLDLTPVDGPFELLGRTVIPIPVVHGTETIFGYRIGSFAYLTDASQVPDTSRPLLERLDVLVLGALRPRPTPATCTSPRRSTKQPASARAARSSPTSATRCRTARFRPHYPRGSSWDGTDWSHG